MSSKRAAHNATIGRLSSQILKNLRTSVPSKGPKTSKQLERHLKGVANHHRIDILMFVRRQEGITVDQIAGALQCNFKTISAHTQKLVQAGLLEKRYLGHNVLHTLSPYGKRFHSFLNTF